MVDAFSEERTAGRSAVIKVPTADGGQGNALAAVLVDAAGNIANPATAAQMPTTLGRKAASASLAVAQAALAYEAVGASATDQILGGAGAIGDFLSHIIIQPATTAAGTVTVKDNATVIFTFTTGTLPSLAPIIVSFCTASVSGAWKITTGLNVAVLGIGNFT